MTSKYYMPTRILSGKDCIKENSMLFKTLGKKALIATGKNSAKRNGSEKDIISALDSEGIPYVIYDRVMTNPTVECAYEGADYARAHGVDFVIAAGGGSPIDAGKAIALLACQDTDADCLLSGQYENRALPLAIVPTTAGSGSEVTQYSILTNDKAQTKTSIASELLFPQLTFLDPRYMEGLPVKTTVNTALDALSHAVEGMLSVRASFLSNTLAAESIRMIMDCIPELLGSVKRENENLISLKVREKLQHASLMAGMVIAQTGTTVVHAMGYSLTYFKDIDHGRANGLLLPEYLKLVEKVQPDLAASVLNALGLSGSDKLAVLTDLLLGSKEELTAEEIRKYSSMAIQTKNMANCIVKPTEEEIADIYTRTFK